MAQKRINDLQLRSDFDATCNMPSDDLVQTWRVTGQQVLDFIEAEASIGRDNLSEGAVGKLSVATATGTYNADGTKDVILADSSGGAVTINLPAAASHPGRVLAILKTSASNTVTIDPNLAETIGGAATKVSYTDGELWRIVSNGTNWIVLDHKAVTPWASYTPTLTGFGTGSNFSMYWKRRGSDILIRGRFQAGTSTATEGRVSLPSSYSSASAVGTLEAAGMATRNSTTDNMRSVLIEPSVAYVTFGGAAGVGQAQSKQNGSVVAQANDTVFLFATIPIANFEE